MKAFFNRSIGVQDNQLFKNSTNNCKNAKKVPAPGNVYCVALYCGTDYKLYCVQVPQWIPQDPEMSDIDVKAVNN